MQDVFAKARVRRTVFQRTRPRSDLPSLVLYMEWLSGEAKRRVIDTDGQEHVIADTVMQSNYRIVAGGRAKELSAKHWPEQSAAPQPEQQRPSS